MTRTEAEIKQQVREFYDQVGWQAVDEGVYQNARYEDLRPVSREYIERCHLRVRHHLPPTGRYLLDAGSGPIQYPAYLTYSEGYRRRVCADLSIVALRGARARIGDHGLFVVADIAHLPFQEGIFEGVVSLHTIHHLPQAEHLDAFQELHRVLAVNGTAVVVNGWERSAFKDLIKIAFRAVRGVRRLGRRVLGRPSRPGGVRPGRAHRQPARRDHLADRNGSEGDAHPPPRAEKRRPSGTYVEKGDSRWLKEQVRARLPLEIRVWRSVNARFLRTFIHERLGGRAILRALFWLEERFPHFFGEHGVYPLIVLRKRAES